MCETLQSVERIDPLGKQPLVFGKPRHKTRLVDSDNAGGSIVDNKSTPRSAMSVSTWTLAVAMVTIITTHYQQLCLAAIPTTVQIALKLIC